MVLGRCHFYLIFRNVNVIIRLSKRIYTIERLCRYQQPYTYPATPIFTCDSEFQDVRNEIQS